MAKRMDHPNIKSPADIASMRVAGQLTAKVLQALDRFIRPGISTAEIDRFCHAYIIHDLKAEPGSLGQYGYPFTVNTSLNEVVCHGMPSEKVILKDGDIVNVDVTVRKDGFYGDSSKMYSLGNVSDQAKNLCSTTQECLYKAIQLVKPGVTTGDIGHVIQQHAELNGFTVVRNYCGHGIGKSMHEAPQVAHYGAPGTGIPLVPGMTFTIEPMINQGKPHTKTLADNWTVVTKDKRLSAQWEHTILVTDHGYEVLTLREEEQL